MTFQESLMKIRIIFLLIMIVLSPLSFGQESALKGAGASSIFPLLIKWMSAYEEKSNDNIIYHSVGSGEGIKQISAGIVDFAVSDFPLKQDILVEKGLVQFPIAIGGIVPTFSLKALQNKSLKMTGAVLADIYLGNIKRWNDPRIASLNPGLKLPEQAIVALFRQDDSGSTFLFTYFLSQRSAKWKKSVGNGTSVLWPLGISVNGSEGMAGFLDNIDGSIGYVEYSYVIDNKLNYVVLDNQEGNFVSPSLTSFTNAGQCINWKKNKGFYTIMGKYSCHGSWPLASAAFVLLNNKIEPPARVKRILNFFNWVFTHGPSIAISLHYSPIPHNIVKEIKALWPSSINLDQ